MQPSSPAVASKRPPGAHLTRQTCLLRRSSAPEAGSQSHGDEGAPFATTGARVSWRRRLLSRNMVPWVHPSAETESHICEDDHAAEMTPRLPCSSLRRFGIGIPERIGIANELPTPPDREEDPASRRATLRNGGHSSRCPSAPTLQSRRSGPRSSAPDPISRFAASAAASCVSQAAHSTVGCHARSITGPPCFRDQAEMELEREGCPSLPEFVRKRIPMLDVDTKKNKK